MLKWYLLDFRARESMKQYKLPVIVREPADEADGKYVAEVPILAGCRAWGDTGAEAIENLQSVASEFIRSFRAHGHRLPDAVEETAYELVGPRVSAEVSVYI
jgi:predicted RNase H-like HicB family nuclease